MSMSASQALPNYYPTSGIGPWQGTLASQDSPYNITPTSVPNYLPEGAVSKQTVLGERMVNPHLSSLYVNPLHTEAGAIKEMQAMMALKNQSAMYAGLLHGVNHFNNCIITLGAQQSDQLPPMEQLPFRLWQMPATPQGHAVQVPIQSLPTMQAMNSDALNACNQMYTVCLNQLLQCQRNLAVLQQQVSSLMPPQNAYRHTMDIPPFMVPVGAMMSHFQAAPMIAMGYQVPVLNSYPLHYSAHQHNNALGQYFFEPLQTGVPLSEPALTAACPLYQQLPVQAMPGWLPFSHSFPNFSPPNQLPLKSPFDGVPLITPPNNISRNEQKDGPLTPEHNHTFFTKKKPTNTLDSLSSSESETPQRKIDSITSSSEISLPGTPDTIPANQPEHEHSKTNPKQPFGFHQMAETSTASNDSLSTISSELDPVNHPHEEASFPRLNGRMPVDKPEHDQIKTVPKPPAGLQPELETNSVSSDSISTTSSALDTIKLYQKFNFPPQKSANPVKKPNHDQSETIPKQLTDVHDDAQPLENNGISPQPSLLRSEPTAQPLPPKLQLKGQQQYNLFIESCRQCDYPNINSAYEQLIKYWPAFSLNHSYDGQGSPMQVICSSPAPIEDKVIAVRYMNQLMSQEASQNNDELALEANLNKCLHHLQTLTPNHQKLLKIALKAPATPGFIQKVSTNPNRYALQGKPKQTTTVVFKESKNRKWVNSYGEQWKKQLKVWQQKEFHIQNDKHVDQNIINKLGEREDLVTKLQILDEKQHIVRDLEFLNRHLHDKKSRARHFFSIDKSAPKTKTKPGNALAVSTVTNGKRNNPPLKPDSLSVHENFQVKGGQLKLVALLDPHSEEIEQSNRLTSLVKNRLKSAVYNRLAEQTSLTPDCIQKALTLALVDINQTLANNEIADLNALNMTMMVSLNNANNQTELWTITLGDAITALLHPDGEIEQLSMESKENHLLGYNILNINTSARGKITRKILASNEPLSDLLICQFNGAVRQTAGLQAIAELIRRQELPLPEAKKERTGSTQQTSDKASAYSPSPVSLQALACAIVEPDDEHEDQILIAQAAQLSGKANKLPKRQLSLSSIKERLRFLPISEEDNNCEAAILQLVNEINSRFASAPDTQHNYLSALYIELLCVYGQPALALLPRALKQSLEQTPAINRLRNAHSVTELKAVLAEEANINLNDSTIDTSTPLYQLYLHQVLQLAEKAYGENNLCETLQCLFEAAKCIDICLGFQYFFTSPLKPFLNNLSAQISLLRQSAAETWHAEDFEQLVNDKLDKRLITLTNNDNDISGDALAKLADYDGLTYRLLIKRLEQHAAIEPLSINEIRKGAHLIQEQGEWEQPPVIINPSTREAKLNDTRQVINDIQACFQEEGSTLLFNESHATQMVLEDIEFDTPCFLAPFNQPASLLELLVDNAQDYSIDTVLKLLENWEDTENENGLSHISRLTYLIHKATRILAQEESALNLPSDTDVLAFKAHIQHRCEQLTLLKERLILQEGLASESTDESDLF